MTAKDLTGFQQHCLKAGYSFVSYRMPGEPTPVTIPGRPRLLDPGTLPENEKGFLFSPYNSSRESLWFKAEMIIKGTGVEEGYFFTPPVTPNQQRPLIFPDNLELPQSTPESAYMNGIKSIISQIKQGTIQKAVLSRVIRLPFEVIAEAPLLFKNLSAAFPNAFVYLLYSPLTGVWLGATPELLLSSTGQRISTMALAGTRKAGTIGDWGKKEVVEQEWVSKYVREKLSESGCTGIEQSRTYTVLAGNVEHLRTDFVAMILGKNLQNLLNKIHPTPAVCGWPTKEASNIISSAENYDRSYYTGYLGPVNIDQKVTLFVNLRCLQAINSQAAIYAGGGITIDSDPVKEWEETSIKSRTLLGEIEKIRILAENRSLD
ncbi:MAG: chorismate-binding protein [Chloroflexota bacterium]|nr:chorismate-binding protein [Lentimicrobium sp.]